METTPILFVPPNVSEDLKTALKQRARELGFVACGVASAGPSQSTSRLETWLNNNFEANMGWMKRPDAVEKRADVRKLFPGAETVLSLAFPYATDTQWDSEEMGNIARYARGIDYHDFLPGRLRELLAWIQSRVECNGKVCVDTAPVLEREWAVRAGIGWIGKNTLLMSRDFGSYVLLGEIILDTVIEPDQAHIESFCGNCTRCLDACPTNALIEPRVLDSNKCIAFHTIENRTLAPKDVRAQFQDWVFGCDICQQVCPWNGKAARDGKFSTEVELWTRPEMPSLEEWTSLEQSEFSRRLKGSPIKRTKRRGMKRNAARALKNRRDKK
ncbi:tRNA epoxyqueuosine(34) reductase QueG [bacterium]|nr:MAG: tRNA epoxyqueuosine(34) reductase QueG [bacterium]